MNKDDLDRLTKAVDLAAETMEQILLNAYSRTYRDAEDFALSIAESMVAKNIILLVETDDFIKSSLCKLALERELEELQLRKQIQDLKKAMAVE